MVKIIERDWDYLKILTKDQIIDFLKQRNWRDAPEERTVKFFKWQIVGQKLLNELENNPKDMSSIAKQIDEFAIEFNKEKGTTKKLKILERRDELIKKFNNHYKKHDEIIKKLDSNDRFLNEN
jgi:hypothetical protein